MRGGSPAAAGRFAGESTHGAVSGSSTGAAIGTAICPGLGTLLGGVLGCLIGAAAVYRSLPGRSRFDDRLIGIEDLPRFFPVIAFSFCFGNFCEFFAKYYMIRSCFARSERGRILCM